MINTKNEKLIIVGASGSGKDYLLRQLTKEGLDPSVKVTTRPIREGEIEGQNYHFKTIDEFDKLELIVSQEFYNDKGHLWKYGVLKEDFNSAQVFIMTPGEILQINEDIRKNCFVVYLDIDRSVREKRLFRREDQNDSVSRRLNADEKDFKDFKDYDLKITDPEFDSESILSLMY